MSTDCPGERCLLGGSARGRDVLYSRGGTARSPCGETGMLDGKGVVPGGRVSGSRRQTLVRRDHPFVEPFE